MSWQPAGEIVISTSSEFMDFETLLKTIEGGNLTGYLAIDFPEQATIYFKEGLPISDTLSVKDKLKETSYTAFFYQQSKNLFLLCCEIADSREILPDQFKFAYEVSYFVDKIIKTNFRGIIVVKKGDTYFLVMDDGEPVMGARLRGGTFEVRYNLIGEILSLGGEAEEIHVFRKATPFSFFEPEEMTESSSFRNIYLIFTRFFSSLRGIIFSTQPILRAIYAPKIEDYESLSRLKSEAQNVYIARGYTKDPAKTIQMVNEFWDVFYKYPKKVNNALFLFGKEKIPSDLQFVEETTSIRESLSSSLIMSRLGLSYETKPLGAFMEDMSIQKLKTLLEIYNLGTPEGKSLKKLKEEIVIKTIGSR